MYAVHAPVQATMLFGHVQVGGEIDKETFVQLMLKMSEFTVKKSVGITDLVRSSKHIFVPRCHGNQTHTVLPCLFELRARLPKTLGALWTLFCNAVFGSFGREPLSLTFSPAPHMPIIILSLSFAIPRCCSALAHCRFVRC
jgi:hypothetical protein